MTDELLQAILDELRFANDLHAKQSVIVTKLLKNIENELQHLNGSSQYPRVDMNPLVMPLLAELDRLVQERKQRRTPQ